MARYDFRCATCDDIFEVVRPMAEADAPATCPKGHRGAKKLLPVFAATGMAAEPMGACGAPVGGGGCCGGACR